MLTQSGKRADIYVLLKEVSEIKHLLFSRLLLLYAGLLAAAIRVDSVKKSLDDIDVKDADLRCICLRIESSGPSEVRNACADLFGNEGKITDIGTY